MYNIVMICFISTVVCMCSTFFPKVIVVTLSASACTHVSWYIHKYMMHTYVGLRPYTLYQRMPETTVYLVCVLLCVCVCVCVCVCAMVVCVRVWPQFRFANSKLLLQLSLEEAPLYIYPLLII